MTILVAIRHLRTQDNIDQKFCAGDRDVSIIGGQVIAKEVLQEIARLSGEQIIAHTGLIRTKQTARLLCDNIGYTREIIEIPDFRERLGGQLAGLPFSEIKTHFPALQHPSDFWSVESAVLGLETVDDFLGRIKTGIAKLRNFNVGSVVLVAHAGSIKGVKATLAQTSDGEAKAVLCETTPNHANPYLFEI